MIDEAFEKRMKALLKDEYDAFIDALNQPGKHALHMNTNKDPQLSLAKKYQLTPHPYVDNGFYFDRDTLQMGRLAYHEAGLYYIQEPSAMIVATLANLKPGMKVLDLCAAPGGKSSKIAMMIGDEGILVTNDISASRSKILSENMERLGFSNTIVTNAKPEHLAKIFPSYFDCVFIDAPCSGEGMFRKRDIAIETWSEEKVDECAIIQEELIQLGTAMLKKDGELIYSTCTYEPKENELQIEKALQSLPLALIPLEIKEGFVEGDIAGTIRLYPHHFDGEGHFIAKMKKTKETASYHPIKPAKSNLTKEQLKLVQGFYQSTLNIPCPDHLFASNDHIYSRALMDVKLDGLHILRQGLYLGECKKNRFEPSLALALHLSKEDALRTYDYPVDSEAIAKYLHGDTLEAKQGDGFGLILVDGFPLGFVKEVQGTLKNFYPKGKRR